MPGNTQTMSKYPNTYRNTLYPKKLKIHREKYCKKKVSSLSFIKKLGITTIKNRRKKANPFLIFLHLTPTVSSRIWFSGLCCPPDGFVPFYFITPLSNRASVPGISIMTSAPKSPSTFVTKGPGINFPNSMT